MLMIWLIISNIVMLCILIFETFVLYRVHKHNEELSEALKDLDNLNHIIKKIIMKLEIITTGKNMLNATRSKNNRKKGCSNAKSKESRQ